MELIRQARSPKHAARAHVFWWERWRLIFIFHVSQTHTIQIHVATLPCLDSPEK